MSWESKRVSVEFYSREMMLSIIFFDILWISQKVFIPFMMKRFVFKLRPSSNRFSFIWKMNALILCSFLKASHYSFGICSWTACVSSGTTLWRITYLFGKTRLVYILRLLLRSWKIGMKFILKLNWLMSLFRGNKLLLIIIEINRCRSLLIIFW